MTPFLQVVTSAKDTVARRVTGVVDLARKGRRWSGELRRSVSQAMDMVLGKSEELVDRFLPMTEAELGTDQRGLELAQGCTAQHSTAYGKPGTQIQVGFLPLLCTPESQTLSAPKTHGAFAYDKPVSNWWP